MDKKRFNDMKERINDVLETCREDKSCMSNIDALTKQHAEVVGAIDNAEEALYTITDMIFTLIGTILDMDDLHPEIKESVKKVLIAVAFEIMETYIDILTDTEPIDEI